MRLELESGKIIDQPTADDIKTMIPAEEFAILSQLDQRYIQFVCHKDIGLYILEYRDGSADSHFSTRTPVSSIDHVISAFQKYLVGDDTWKSDFEWTRDELNGHGCFSVFLGVFVIVLMLVAA